MLPSFGALLPLFWVMTAHLGSDGAVRIGFDCDTFKHVSNARFTRAADVGDQWGSHSTGTVSEALSKLAGLAPRAARLYTCTRLDVSMPAGFVVTMLCSVAG